MICPLYLSLTKKNTAKWMRMWKPPLERPGVVAQVALLQERLGASRTATQEDPKRAEKPQTQTEQQASSASSASGKNLQRAHSESRRPTKPLQVAIGAPGTVGSFLGGGAGGTTSSVGSNLLLFPAEPGLECPVTAFRAPHMGSKITMFCL